MMTPREHAVLLSFGFYLLNLLVPIVPAVIIYRLFPEARANNTVEGNVGAWKIKAVGAWGAYVTAFLLGFWAINSTAVPLIKAVAGKSVWQLDSVNFQLQDEEDTLDKLSVVPSVVELQDRTHAGIEVISDTIEAPKSLHVKLPGTTTTCPWRALPPRMAKLCFQPQLS